MTKTVIRMSCAAALTAAVAALIWYTLMGSSTAVSPDAVLVQRRDYAGQNRDCFLLQEMEQPV